MTLDDVIRDFHMTELQADKTRIAYYDLLGRSLQEISDVEVRKDTTGALKEAHGYALKLLPLYLGRIMKEDK